MNWMLMPAAALSGLVCFAPAYFAYTKGGIPDDARAFLWITPLCAAIGVALVLVEEAITSRSGHVELPPWLVLMAGLPVALYLPYAEETAIGWFMLATHALAFSLVTYRLLRSDLFTRWFSKAG